jgi:hypothetical protein
VLLQGEQGSLTLFLLPPASTPCAALGPGHTAGLGREEVLAGQG